MPFHKPMIVLALAMAASPALANDAITGWSVSVLQDPFSQEESSTAFLRETGDDFNRGQLGMACSDEGIVFTFIPNGMFFRSEPYSVDFRAGDTLISSEVSRAELKLLGARFSIRGDDAERLHGMLTASGMIAFSFEDRQGQFQNIGYARARAFLAADCP